MKVVFVGDPHFKIDNMLEVDIFVKRMVELCEKEKPDFICIGGDLLHTHEKLHTIPLNKAYDFVDKMRNISHTYILVGNHDMICNRQFLNNHHWMNGMKKWENVTIVDKIIHAYYDDKLYVFSPYVEPGRFEEALCTIDDVDKNLWKNACCIFAHQEFYGCSMEAITSVEGDKWDDGYPFVISGHIHSKQRLKKNIYYSGSSMQHTFGESGNNIIPILTWDDKNNMNIQEIDLKLPRKKTIHRDVSDLDKIVLNEGTGKKCQEENRGENGEEKSEEKGGENGVENRENKQNNITLLNKTKIVLSGNYEEFIAIKKTKKYRELIDKGAKIVFKAKKQKQNIDKYNDVNKKNFSTILKDLIDRENNHYLNILYKKIL